MPSTSKLVPLQQADSGLKVFLSRWQMNDFFFMIIGENISPNRNHEEESNVWFVVVPQQTRHSLVKKVAGILDMPAQKVPFLLARLLTISIFLVIVMFQVFPKNKTASPENFLQAAFLILAWFWLLAPTQNPWYWIWAVPLLPFAKNRAWLMLAGLVFVYYLRFWLEEQPPQQRIWNTQFAGAHFFDYIVVWFEYLPWLISLLLYRLICYLRHHHKTK